MNEFQIIDTHPIFTHRLKKLPQIEALTQSYDGMLFYSNVSIKTKQTMWHLIDRRCIDIIKRAGRGFSW